MTTKPTTEAVEALSRAARLSFDDGVFAPHEFIRALSEECFTITRAEPVMSDAELELDAVLQAIDSAEFVTRGIGFPHGGTQAVGYTNYAVLKIPGRSQLHAKHWFERFKEELAKKYRGQP